MDAKSLKKKKKKKCLYVHKTLILYIYFISVMLNILSTVMLTCSENPLLLNSIANNAKQKGFKSDSAKADFSDLLFTGSLQNTQWACLDSLVLTTQSYSNQVMEIAPLWNKEEKGLGWGASPIFLKWEGRGTAAGRNMCYLNFKQTILWCLTIM